MATRPGGHSLLIPEQQQSLLTEHFQPFSDMSSFLCFRLRESSCGHSTSPIPQPHHSHSEQPDLPSQHLLFPGLDF